MPKHRQPACPIPEANLEGWGFWPTKRWYVTAKLDIYRAGGRVARKGDRLHVAVDRDRIFFHRQELYAYEFEDLVLLQILLCGISDVSPIAYRVAARFLAEQSKSAPKKVDDLFKEVKDGNPSYSDEQAWATAWSVYCKSVDPNGPHCHRKPGEYLK